MDMNLIITALCALGVGYYIGWHKAIHDIEVELDREDFGDDPYYDEVANREEKVKDAIIEYHDPYYLAYDANHHAFLGQGKSVDELEEYLVDRYPDTTFEITPENLKQLGL